MRRRNAWLASAILTPDKCLAKVGRLANLFWLIIKFVSFNWSQLLELEILGPTSGLGIERTDDVSTTSQQDSQHINHCAQDFKPSQLEVVLPRAFILLARNDRRSCYLGINEPPQGFLLHTRSIPTFASVKEFSFAVFRVSRHPAWLQMN